LQNYVAIILAKADFQTRQLTIWALAARPKPPDQGLRGNSTKIPHTLTAGLCLPLSSPPAANQQYLSLGQVTFFAAPTVQHFIGLYRTGM